MQRIDIRIAEETKEMLATICKKDGRSMTKEIEQLIIERYNLLVWNEK